MTDAGAPPRASRRRGIVVGLAVAVAVVGVADVGLVALDPFATRAPSHEISLTNDTAATISWSCSWSEIELSPGATAPIRVLDHPDQDFGCVTGPDIGQDVTCANALSVTAGRQFTATEWLRAFRCP
ncbi:MULTISPECIES: hypothetical protein [unclassified Rathayibacter]|uniref:hypothetical protein n=1 Tax=unclassified Rathayibacter TaxID=2609250 RepID=UPI0006FB2B8D|nr:MULTISPECIES: hypothetical protein [unclassified Rathayibacter]KQQ05754.1 hypothetical protein ASF42_04095 [Rathayibacter sp. Leaf294]KQS13612.1 hypothetical protein ASG06_04105 [Rathayibacter sp. Leaf185]